MKKYWLFHAMVLGLCLAAGCQPAYWYQEGRTFDESKADQADCRAELLKRTDRNHMSDYERRFMENCMEQRGYRLVPDSGLPLDVKREEPNAVTAVPWNRFYGVAGSIDDNPGQEMERYRPRKETNSPIPDAALIRLDLHPSPR